MDTCPSAQGSQGHHLGEVGGRGQGGVLAVKRGRRLPGSLLRPRVSSLLLELKPEMAAEKSLVNHSALQSRPH